MKLQYTVLTVLLLLARPSTAQSIYNGDFEALPPDDGWTIGVTSGSAAVIEVAGAPSPTHVMHQSPTGIANLGWVWADSQPFTITRETLSVAERGNNVDAYLEIRTSTAEDGQLTALLLPTSGGWQTSTLDVSPWCGSVAFVRVASTVTPATLDNWAELDDVALSGPACEGGEDAGTDTDAGADGDADTGRDADTGLDGDVGVGPDSDSGAGPDSEVDVGSDLDADREVGVDPDALGDADLDAAADLDADVVTDTHAEADSDGDIASDPGRETATETDVNPPTDADPDVEIESAADSDSGASADSGCACRAGPAGSPWGQLVALGWLWARRRRVRRRGQASAP